MSWPEAFAIVGTFAVFFGAVCYLAYIVSKMES